VQFGKLSAVDLLKRRCAASAEAFIGAWLGASKLPPPRLLYSSPWGLRRCLAHSDG